jgi:mRNA interferase MazF
MGIDRFDVYLVNLDPAVGSEMPKTRPCLVVSPNELNRNLQTVIVAPMTSKVRPRPARPTCHFKGKKGQIVLDQLRTVDRCRLVRHWAS